MIYKADSLKDIAAALRRLADGQLMNNHSRTKQEQKWNEGAAFGYRQAANMLENTVLGVDKNKA